MICAINTITTDVRNPAVPVFAQETIYVWPDHMWCMSWEHSDFSHRSDDFVRLQVNADCSPEEIEALVELYFM